MGEDGRKQARLVVARAAKSGNCARACKGTNFLVVISSLDDKKRLLGSCLSFVRARVEQISASLEEAREASFSETKSSAGDKYETGREMMRIQSDMRALQLYEAQDLLSRLERIDVSQAHDKVRAGSVVWTTNGLYFVTQSIGMIALEGFEYQTISLAAPMGKALKGLGAGEFATFRDQQIEILSVL